MHERVVEEEGRGWRERQTQRESVRKTIDQKYRKASGGELKKMNDMAPSVPLTEQ
jgi:hypothetical protein